MWAGLSGPHVVRGCCRGGGDTDGRPHLRLSLGPALSDLAGGAGRAGKRRRGRLRTVAKGLARMIAWRGLMVVCESPSWGMELVYAWSLSQPLTRLQPVAPRTSSTCARQAMRRAVSEQINSTADG